MKKRNSCKNMFSGVGFYALMTAVALAVFSVGAAAQVIYDNGPFITGAVSKNGTAAPAGKQWSEVQNDNGNTTESNTLAASGCQAVPGGNNRCADDFSVPVGETWTINTLTVYIIQIGAVTNPVNNMNLRVWTGGKPADPGATIIFGDTTTNRFLSGTDTNVLRCFNSAVPTSNVPRTDLTVWEVKVTLSPALVLTAGTYWVDFQTTTTAAQFTPLTTHVGARGVPMNNARQFTSSTGLWANVFDTGNPAAAADVQLDIPFKLEGSRSGVATIPRNRWLDFDGDNISDFAIARSTSSSSPTDWWIKKSGGGITSVPVGNGVGFDLGETAAPADYDGDGKTDIATWRRGSSPNAGFVILRSTTGTVTFEQFGQNGDDPSVIRDYDGDNKADPAIYRGGAQGIFYYRGTLNNPNGNITFVPWGTTGDNCLPGDFDGDGKADFAIFRNNGGVAEHWQLLSGGGTRTFQYGVTSTDRFITGDYDLDNKTDVAVVRNAGGGQMQWFILKSADLTTVSELFGNFFTDFPIAGDYDGDGRTDIAIWRSGTGADKGTFFIRNSHSARSQEKWGTSNADFLAPDFPVGYFNVR